MTRPITKTIGCDLGDKYSHVCVLNASGEVEGRARVATTRSGFHKWFSSLTSCTVVLETGTHSRWVSQALEQMGHEVIVANARKVRLISQGQRKNDRADAETLARLARADRQLLSPVRHRSDEAQQQRGMLHSRDQLVKARTQLINHVRGISKAAGVRIKKCESSSFVRHARVMLPQALLEALEPLLSALQTLSEQIGVYDKKLEQLGRECAQVQPILTIHGVGALTALAFVHTLEHPQRFEHSRQAGAYIGLVPKQRQSGDSDPQLRISKAGDGLVRRLLVNCAQRILGPFGQDSDLRRYGLRLLQRGGRYAKKRAVVAVARKLAVLMHRLWRSGEVYEPFHHGDSVAAA